MSNKSTKENEYVLFNKEQILADPYNRITFEIVNKEFIKDDIESKLSIEYTKEGKLHFVFTSEIINLIFDKNHMNIEKFYYIIETKYHKFKFIDKYLEKHNKTKLSICCFDIPENYLRVLFKKNKLKTFCLKSYYRSDLKNIRLKLLYVRTKDIEKFDKCMEEFVSNISITRPKLYKEMHEALFKEFVILAIVNIIINYSVDEEE